MLWVELAVRHVCFATGCVSCLFCNWLCVMSVLQLAVCHVCVATDRLNKSIIRMSVKIHYQLRQVCLSVCLSDRMEEMGNNRKNDREM